MLRLVGGLLLKLLRWRVEGAFPNEPRLVVVAAPHTSNWDFVVGIAAALALDLEAHWLGKHTLFRWPFAGLLRGIGGIPVDRSAGERVVDDVVAQFRRREKLFLAIAPEGTRKKVERWKSGFYRVASGAGVPMLPVALDYRVRVIRLCPTHTASGDYDKDLAILQRHFTSAMAKHPDAY